MQNSNYINDLQNQYFELEILVINQKATEAQRIRFAQITDELKDLPDNVLSLKKSSDKDEKKTINRKLKF